MLEAPYPELDDLLEMMGEAGQRLSDIEASEGAAGNVSICSREPLDVTSLFTQVQNIDLPLPAPKLAGATLLITGSGRRLRDISDEPTANLACISVEEDGRRARMFTSPDCRFRQVTSEFNSHLAVHHDQMQRREIHLHTVLHAQPVYLTYLSHIPGYQDERYFNTHLLRWQPETILNLPEGIGLIPFRVPSSPELMADSVACLRTHRIALWAKHGVIARSDVSVKRAADRVEYAETAARYEHLNLTTGEIAEGLSVEEIRAICSTFKIDQTIF